MTEINRKRSKTLLRRGGEAILVVRPPRRTSFSPPDSGMERLDERREKRGIGVKREENIREMRKK